MFKDFLKKAGIVFLQLAVLSGVLFYIAQKRGLTNFSQVVPAIEKAAQKGRDVISVEKPLPEATSPITKNFNWTYKGVKYSLTMDLDEAVYDYYATSPKSYSYLGALPPNWENEYYEMFLDGNKDDKTIEILAGKLWELGKKHKLSDDQIVDLTLAFVQAIEYDDAKAKNILAKTGNESMLYPYEILFSQKGVCSDKSILAYDILKSMGYGVALLAFEDDNHMALGVECPKEYSTYGDGYCYAETTSVGNKIGIVPGFDVASNKTVDAELKSFDHNQIQASNLRQLGQVSLYNAITGKSYSGIIATKKTLADISALRKKLDSLAIDLASQKKNVTEEENKLKNMQKNLDSMSKAELNVDVYKLADGKYNDFLAAYKKDVKKYNDSVNLYNKTVEAYNSLIRN